MKDAVMGRSKLSKPKTRSTSRTVRTRAINVNPGIFVFSDTKEVMKKVLIKNTADPK